MRRKRYRENKNAFGNQVSAYMRFVILYVIDFLKLNETKRQYE